MRPRIACLIIGLLSAPAISLLSPAAGVSLTCAPHPDLERAALEAVAGDHPSWADAYIVGRVDEIQHPPFDGIRLSVTPTHVFSGDIADRIRIAARSDGPPDPASWSIGAYYFLALAGESELDGVSGLVAPCAPNFRITTTEQLDRLIGAAPTVEVRDEVSLSASDPGLGAVVVLGAAASVIGLWSWVAFRRPRRERST